MTEPVLFGFPLHLMVLYFLLYSCMGWVLETTYCSLTERRFVVRGFLYGPVCPIYGVGVLMMLCWFAPFTGSPPVFYLMATLCMSAWEYFVGWFLEATTHIKYWDYSMFPLNLHGRICLWVCLIWGLLAYVMIFWIHPYVSAQVLMIPLPARRWAAVGLFTLFVADAAFTIRDLALMSRLLSRLTQAGDELRVQLSLGRAQLLALLDAAPGTLDDAAERLRGRYEELLDKAERRTRRFLTRYSHMSSRSWADTLAVVRSAGSRLRNRLQDTRRPKAEAASRAEAASQAEPAPQAEPASQAEPAPQAEPVSQTRKHPVQSQE